MFSPFSQCGTGQLLTSWRAHYKQITAICFTGEHAFIVTAGEDGIINVWSLASVYDSAQLEPFITWSEHTLPITNLYRGLGGARARIISSSLDRTCRVSCQHSARFSCNATALGFAIEEVAGHNHISYCTLLRHV